MVERTAIKITLIVSAVFISIFAILIIAVVLLVAISSSLQAGKKLVNSGLKSAVSSIKATQIRLDQNDYEGITVDRMQQDDPDINWTSSRVSKKSDSNTVRITQVTDVDGSKIIYLTAFSKNDENCLYAKMRVEQPTLYAKQELSVAGYCPDPTA